jgi:hypothetical protein
VAKKWESLYYDARKRHHELLLFNIDVTLEAFCEINPDLTIHYASIKDDELIIKIGDDDVLADVDARCFCENGTIMALEKAHIEWLAKKEAEDGEAC